MDIAIHNTPNNGVRQIATTCCSEVGVLIWSGVWWVEQRQLRQWSDPIGWFYLTPDLPPHFHHDFHNFQKIHLQNFNINMISRRDFPTSKELEHYALAVVNFVCCHSYARNTTDECEYIRTRSPTLPPTWMSESPNEEQVSITNIGVSKGYITGMTDDIYLIRPYQRQSRNSKRMLDTKGFPPRPAIMDSPESVNTWNLGTWIPGHHNMAYRDPPHMQDAAPSVASSSDSSIFGHPVYSL